MCARFYCAFTHSHAQAEEEVGGAADVPALAATQGSGSSSSAQCLPQVLPELGAAQPTPSPPEPSPLDLGPPAPSPSESATLLGLAASEPTTPRAPPPLLTAAPPGLPPTPLPRTLGTWAAYAASLTPQAIPEKQVPRPEPSPPPLPASPPGSRSAAAASSSREPASTVEPALAATQGFRREGLPTSALVDRRGDLYVASPMRMLQNMTYVLGIRLRKLQEAGLPSAAAYLPVTQQKEALVELRQCWENSAPGRRVAEKVRSSHPHRRVSLCRYSIVVDVSCNLFFCLCIRTGRACQVWSRTTKRFAVNMKSYWRVHCHKQFGGQLWLGVLLALGDVPPLAVQISNQVIAERIRAAAGREAQGTAVPGPRLSAQNAARARGDPVPPVAGPTDRISDAKVARHRAKELEKRKRLGTSNHAVGSSALSHLCRHAGCRCVDITHIRPDRKIRFVCVSHDVSAVCRWPCLLVQWIYSHYSTGRRTRRGDGVAAA